MIAGLLLSVCVMQAQQSLTQAEMQQKVRQQFHQRDASQKHLQMAVPLQKVQKSTTAADSAGLQLPEGAWFPGEWEEVKAIAVTCSYSHLVPGNENSYYWYADPLVNGYAAYMHYEKGGWEEKGGGPYISVIDTVSDHGNVFFYLMDAIQSGNAEAWVRIENASDSAVVLRKLDRMKLRHDRIRFMLGGGNSFWFRDCGPICFYYGDQDSTAMLDFMYYPGRGLDDSLPSLIQKYTGIPDYITSIEWEGGNCLVDGAGMVISSDALYANNADVYGQMVWDGKDPKTLHIEAKTPLTSAQVKDSLAHLMGSRSTYILPSLKFDGGTGHIDLYADMVDENSFVFSRYPEYCSRWSDYKTANRNIADLITYKSVFDSNYKHTFIPFPCDEYGQNFESQIDYDDDYTRTYSNHTFVNQVLVQPCFSKVVNGQPSAEWDRMRVEQLKQAYPGYTIYPIDVSTFDGSGGAIHCITKQIPADNPIRILHPSVTGNTETAYAGKNVPLRAKVTNRSGLETVKVMWRVDGGEWQESIMQPSSDNMYLIDLPLSGVSYDGYAKVEYYLSAKSNNGKTMTKPITAPQGGYYTFYLGHNPSVGVREAVEAKVGGFYPNPSREQASIRFTGADGAYAVRVFDASGRLCRQDVTGADEVYTLSVSGFAAGVYRVVFTDAQGRHVLRTLVVE